MTSVDELLDGGDDGLQTGLRVAEQHLRVVLEVELVLDAGVAGHVGQDLGAGKAEAHQLAVQPRAEAPAAGEQSDRYGEYGKSADRNGIYAQRRADGSADRGAAAGK